MTRKIVLLTFIVSFLCGHTSLSAAGSGKTDRWHSDKFSMFIHFGLYSELGGVWDGKLVENGYSEQIQSFAGIFSDWYAMTADRFDPVNFDADSIVSLAKKAGMRSIIFTSKHHDGFCMFGTETTDFNSVDATPSGRDYVKELSEACAKGGINLGLYFSIIDWHYPHAYPISSHNCDFITDEHHEYNKSQVTELLTRYGDISELWFDMGSQTPEQSRELYELVHSLQPDCMVSGRVGNDYYDFAVMGDNKYPDAALQAPWQTAASMFNETWSYRSWQERGDVKDKIKEKLRSLVNVVSHGGNYLLNIGPDGTGAVIPFEREVLYGIGRWLDVNGDAIYGTSSSPYRENFGWGAVTVKDRRLNLILSGKMPDNGMIVLELDGNRPEKVTGPCRSESRNGKLVLYPTAGAFDSISVIRVDLSSAPGNVMTDPLDMRKTHLLTRDNAYPDYSYSCFDYYSNYKSMVSYNWIFTDNKVDELQLLYTAQELGKKIDLKVDGSEYEISLGSENVVQLSGNARLVYGPVYMSSRRISSFDVSDPSMVSDEELEKWEKVDVTERTSFQSRPFMNHFLVQNIEASKEELVIMEVGAGNGIEVFLNGTLVMKHLNPYRCIYRAEKMLLPLKKGNNQIKVRVYNRFEKHVSLKLRPSQQQVLYRTSVRPDFVKGTDVHSVSVRENGLPSPHKCTELSNLQIRVK